MTTDLDVLACRDDAPRRKLARDAQLNGFDEVDVGEDQTTLAVTFLGRAPQWIRPAHLRLDGGRRIRDLRIVDVRIEAADDEDADDVIYVIVDRPGDFSTYRLCVTGIDAHGRSTGRPPADFDPRYACVDVRFKTACPSELDCAAAPNCDAEVLPKPAIDYLAKDYASFRRLMLDRLALLMPDWTERHVPDLGITLVELFAYVGDHLSYRQDAVATEAYLETARLRVSVRRHLRLIDDFLHEGCNARTWLVFDVDDDEVSLAPGDFHAITAHPTLQAPMLRQVDLPATEPVPFVAFAPVGHDRITLRRARNRIAFYRWGQDDCCIVRGATSATLLDPGTVPDAPPLDRDRTGPVADFDDAIADGRRHLLRLKPCDVLVFEEVLGPRTGHPADADAAHRHAVRLTKAEPSFDPVTRQLVWEIAWCAEDALPFPLCLSSVTEAPACRPLVDVSVAWGNVVLVDHGMRCTDPLGSVPCGPTTEHCADACDDATTETSPGRYRPRLPRPEPTFADTVAACVPECLHDGCGGCGALAAGATVTQSVDAAIAAVTLTSRRPDDDAVYAWQPRPDLLHSGPDDRHFTVEVDDLRVAWLRFGDGTSGRRPEAHETFVADYRVGNGTRGNVGADTLVQLLFRDSFPDGRTIRVRNPLPASGGTAPENVADARERGPRAIHRRLERAVTPDDYAAIVLRDFAASVQGAAAEFRTVGARVQVRVAVDALGRATADEALLRCIASHLRGYRRIGHDVHVVAAASVALDVALHVCVARDHLRAHVRAALLAVLGTGPLPRALQTRWRTTGFFAPDALRLGTRVSASRLVAVAQSVDGVAGVVLERFERLFEGPDGELASGVLAIGPLEVARLDHDADAPENGRLVLTLEGGR